MPLRFASPRTPSQFELRNELLQATLRPPDLWNGPAPFPIADEYPIVLSKSCGHYSYCLYDRDGNLVSHANLWPRSVVTRCATAGSNTTGANTAANKTAADITAGDQTTSLGLVGLIGNVATHADHRGLGYSSKLLAHLEKSAVELNLQALVLWSDLSSFYQKRGYRSLGWEWRYIVPGADGLLPRHSPAKADYYVDLISDPDKVDLQHLLGLRPWSGATLGRSTQEFAELLKIPSTNLFVFKSEVTNPSRVLGYGIVGKGADMVGFVHEWGVAKAADLVPMLAEIIAVTGYGSLGVMIPGQVNSTYERWLTEAGYKGQKYPMALGKRLKERQIPSSAETSYYSATPGVTGNCYDALDQGFIWGLDSI